MKTRLVPLAALLLLPLALPLASPAQATSSDVTVHLVIDRAGDRSGALEPTHHTCDVQVPAGANGGDVLDAAAASLCIAHWTYTTFAPNPDRFVTSIDGQLGADAFAPTPCPGNPTDLHFLFAGTYWAFYYPTATTYSNAGIDDVSVNDSETLRFSYESYQFGPDPGCPL